MRKPAPAPSGLNLSRALLERSARQRLTERAGSKELKGVVRALCGVNAQQGSAMMLSLRARLEGLERAHVESAVEAGALVRAWTFRGTMHLLDPDDLRGFLPLLAPALIKASEGRYRQLGLTVGLRERALSAVPEILSASGRLTRYELAEALAERGIGVDSKGQALIHLIRFVALNGLIYIGPDNRKGEPTYILLDPPAPAGDMGDGGELAGLALRYLEGYGPADARDFAAWSGVNLSRAGKSWDALGADGSIREVRVDGRELSLPASKVGRRRESPAGVRVVRLLPAFDTYVLGYAARELVVPEARKSDVFHGGQTVPVMLVDGAAAGTWRYERSGRKMRIRVRPFGSFGPAVRKGISAEAEDIGRFFDSAVTLDVE